MMTREQEQVIDQSLIRGIVKSHREAHEMGCAALRRQLQELEQEESAKLAAAMRAEHEALKGKIDGMVTKSKITPAARDKMLGGGTVQFSVEGDLVPTMTIGQVVDMLDECLPEGSLLTGNETQFSVEDHPDGSKHYKGDAPVSEAEAQKIVDGQSNAIGGMFKQPA